MKRWILFYTCVFIASIVLAIFNVPFWMGMVLLVVVALLMATSLIWTLYFTKNLQAIEKQLRTKKNEPIYSYALAIAHGTKEEQISCINQILHKYNQPFMQTYYAALREIINENYEAAYEIAIDIQKPEIRTYILANIRATQGDEAVLNQTFEKKWMAPAVKTTHAYVTKQKEMFEKNAKQSLSHAGGIQYYSLYYAFEKMGKELKN